MRKLITYNYKGLTQWGVLSSDDKEIIPSELLEETYFIPLSENLFSFINSGDEGLINLEKCLTMNEKDNAVPTISINDVEIEIPFISGRNIFCVGKNYKSHVKEFENTNDIPSTPVFFTKAASSLTATNKSIIRHYDISKELDYEGELAIVIGKKGTDIKEEDALNYIYGYTIINDITSRDLQRSHEQWFKGKSLDTFCPIGPVILTGSNNTSFTIETKVNGELRQKDSTDNMIFSISKIISNLSKGITLLPGDIIATGTPQGVGMGFNPPKFLKSGDKIEITISNIGSLVNNVK